MTLQDHQTWMDCLPELRHQGLLYVGRSFITLLHVAVECWKVVHHTVTCCCCTMAKFCWTHVGCLYWPGVPHPISIPFSNNCTATVGCTHHHQYYIYHLSFEFNKYINTMEQALNYKCGKSYCNSCLSQINLKKYIVICLEQKKLCILPKISWGSLKFFSWIGIHHLHKYSNECHCVMALHY